MIVFCQDMMISMVSLRERVSEEPMKASGISLRSTQDA